MRLYPVAILLLAASVAAAQPITVDVTGRLNMLDGTLVPASTTAPATVQFRLSAPVQAAAADGSGNLEWVSQFTSTVTVTDSSAFAVSLVPNTCADCTVTPTTSYYDVRVKYTGGSFDQRWIVPCSDAPSCPDVRIGTVPVNNTVDPTIDALAATGDTATGLIVFDSRIRLTPASLPATGVMGEMAVSADGDLYVHDGSDWVLQGAGAGLDTSEVLAGSGIDVGVEGDNVRITNTAASEATIQAGLYGDTGNTTTLIVGEGDGINLTQATHGDTRIITETVDFGDGDKQAVEGDNPRMLSQAENDAAQGSSGSPSNTNRFITQEDVATSSTASEIPRAGGDGKISNTWLNDLSALLENGGAWQLSLAGLAVAWADVTKTGSNLTDILTRNHNDLQNLDVGDYRHLTAALLSALTGGGNTTAHYHDADRVRANHTGTQLQSTISDFAHGPEHTDGTDAVPVAHGLRINNSRVESYPGTGLYVGADSRLYTDSTGMTITAYADHVAATNNPHGTDVENLGAGTLAELNDAITDANLDDAGDPRDPNPHASEHVDGTDNIPVDQGIQITSGRLRAKVATGLYIGADHSIYTDSVNTTIASMGGDITGPSNSVTVTKVQGYSLTYPAAANDVVDGDVWQWDAGTQAFILDAQSGTGGSLTGQIAGASDTTIDTVNVSLTGTLEALLSGDTLTISGSSGAVVQVVETDFTEVVSTTTTVPFDNSAPTSSEGVQVGSISITPYFSDSWFIVEAQGGSMSNGAISTRVAFICRDSETDSLAATHMVEDADYEVTVPVSCMVPVTHVGATTFSLRCGSNNASTFDVNAKNDGTRMYGATVKSFIRVWEVRRW